MNKEDILSIVPLLPAQQFMLSASLKGKSSEYVQQLTFEVTEYELGQISFAIERLVETYECLHSHILFEGLKQPVWACLKNSKPRISGHQCTENLLNDRVADIRNRGFDLQKEPAIAFDWFVTESATYLLITNHHILFDGWGRQQLLGDFMLILSSPKLYLPKKTNKDWYDGWKALDHSKAVEAYSKYLLPLEESATLTEFPDGGSGYSEIKREIDSTALKRFSKARGLTLAETVNFLWSCFIAGWTGCSKVQFGVVKQNGLIEQVKNGFGLAIQTLPFQFEISLDASPSELLNGFKERERSVVQFPFVDVTSDLFKGIAYSMLIAFENYPVNEQLKNFQSNFKLIGSYDFSEFPLSLALTPSPDRLILQWHFDLSKHSFDQISSVSDAFEAFLVEPDKILNLSVGRAVQPHLNTFKEYSSKEFIEKIENSLLLENRFRTYEKLSSRFSELNYRRIWIYGDKCADMDLVLCAAWKSSVEVLMVNEKETDGFIHILLAISPPDLIFTSSNDRGFEKVVLINELLADSFPPAVNFEFSTAALSVCTSGSTGEPKVVQLSLENLVSFFHAWNEKLPWREQECFGVVAHPAFDIGVAELIFPLWKGWEKVLVSKEMLSDTKSLIKIFEKVTAFHMVPALLENWIDIFPNDDKERIIMTGGDRVPQRIQKNLHHKFPAARLFQFYGPSECSVLTVGFENKGQFNPDSLPIGTPFINAVIYIVSESLSICMPFQEGEILIVGPSVGLGYANSDMTEKFVSFFGERAYKTGDRGVMDTSGNIYFKGRKDHQVKINGQRIELSRIEFALHKWSGIEKWCVVYEHSVLAAFYASTEKVVLPERELLLELLPAYAVPHLIENVGAFPLNKNGKVDISQLKDRIRIVSSTMGEHMLPEEIKSIFTELFPNKNFNTALGWFANGFNSIDAMKLSGKFKKSLQKEISVNSILTCSNIGQLPELTSVLSVHKDDFIIPGVVVHESAARMFFLSESDPKFAKTYWIHTGFQFPKQDGLLPFLTKWVASQEHLALKVFSNKNHYKWGKAAIRIQEINALDQAGFVEQVSLQNLNSFEELIRINFASRAEYGHLISFSVHHGFLDGLGVQQLLDSFYKDFLSGEIRVIRFRAPHVKPVDTQFWTKRLEKVQIHKLPFQRPQPLQSKSTLRRKLSEEERNVLRSIQLELSCSIFEAALVSWIRHWYRYFPKADFATGVMVSMSNDWSDDSLMGMSVNTLPFVVDSEDSRTILQQWRELFSHANEPFAGIAQLEKNKQNEGTPFFNTSFVYNQWQSRTEVEPLNFELRESAFDLSLDFIDQDSEWFFQWEFNSEKFSEAAIQNFHRSYFGKQDDQVVSFPDFKIKGLKSRWDEVVVTCSQQNALRFGDEVLTYGELDEQVKLFSEWLNYSGTGIVPLLLQRTPKHIACVLSCLINGIPFIPIDVDTPEERVRQIEELISQKAVNPDQETCPVINESVSMKEMSYAIATSGSTGIPKLVGVKRSGYEAAVEAWKYHYELQESDRILQAASFSFDVFLGDIGRSLFQGAELVLLDSFQRKDPSFIASELERRKITFFETTPLVARWWMQEEKLPNFSSLRLLVVGSDAWKIGEMKTLMTLLPASVKLLNSYGLSETTIDNTYFEFSDVYQDGIVVPIGKSMLHSKVSIVSESGGSLSVGLEGFLCIDGPCVGKGYFDGNEWSHKEGPWISADRGVLDEFGNLHFLGRSDKQVKIRGQRLEIQEVESILASCSPQTDWMVFDFDSGFATELAVAYTKEISDAAIHSIRSSILDRYPSYFLPSVFFRLKEVKMNRNGKLDLDHLRLELKNYKQKNTSEISADASLDRVKHLMLNVFNKEISGEDNFFSLGLSSFDAMLFVREWNRHFSSSLKVFHLFSTSNFDELAHLSEELTFDTQNLSLNQDSIFANKAQEALWIDMQDKDPSIYNLPHFVPLPKYAIQKIQVLAETIRMSRSLFSKFVINNDGRLVQKFIDSKDFKLERWKMTNEEYIEFKQKAYFQSIDLENGPCFEAAIIAVDGEMIFYFNPHHLVYDGGSDETFMELFNAISQGETPFQTKNEFAVSAGPSDWEMYFKLSPNPSRLKSTSIVNGESKGGVIWSELTSLEFNKIKELQKSWRTAGSVIYSVLLSEAMQKAGCPLNWISLIMDTRDVPEIGMFMRAFPFPVGGGDSLTELSGKTKAALSFLFENKNETVIYPESVDFSMYHQVGLILQHPAFFEQELNYSPDSNSRPRLPLTLYVEQFNERTFLRWEFMTEYFTKEKIETIQHNFKDRLKVISQMKLQPVDYVLQPSIKKHVSKSSGISQEHPYADIWRKYAGTLAENNFFASGGSSLQALLMLNELNKTFSVNISLSEFFKDPTFSSLSNQNLVDDNELLWQFKSGKRQEEWFLPPIFGLALIFNSYPVSEDSSAFAFNYPMAIGHTSKYSSIEDLAELLLKAYKSSSGFPKRIDKITAYSMGGIVAFEMVKSLERQGVEVGSLVIWDKPAQIQVTRPMDEKVPLKQEVLDYVDRIVEDTIQRKRMVNYLEFHQQLIEAYVQSGTVKCPIQLYYCEEGFDFSEIQQWELLTESSVELLPLKGISHYEIPEHWVKLGWHKRSISNDNS